MTTLEGYLNKALRLAASGLFLAAWFASSALAQASSPLDYLGIPGPIEFAGTSYRLAWSSKPAANYIKQEYLPSGQQPASFQDMVLVELQTAGFGVADVIKSQIQTLERRKSQDPLVYYQLLQNPKSNQAVLDFLLSDRSSGTLIVEWNAYRYVPVSTPNGTQALVLFGISRRHYGDDANTFLKTLQTRRLTDIDILLTHSIPGVEAAP